MFACRVKEDNLIFVGEGENWSSKVTVIHINGQETYQIQMNYKKYGIQDLETFNYHVASKIITE